MQNKQSLWFIRKNELITGPFTPAIIKNDLILGRLTLIDEVSRNKLDWVCINTIWELSLNLENDNIENRQKQLDERNGFDRRNPDNSTPPGAISRVQERRKPQPPDYIEHRQAQTLLIRRFRQQNHKTLKPLLSVFFLLLTTVLLAVIYPKQLPERNNQCNQPAGINVNWNNCLKPKLIINNQDLTGMHLRNSQLINAQLINNNFTNADLAYADLRFAKLNYTQFNNAILLGANLKNSDLSSADLSNVDLSYADLRNANMVNTILKNTRFDHAIWIDGQLCGLNSIDQCVVSKGQ